MTRRAVRIIWGATMAALALALAASLLAERHWHEAVPIRLDLAIRDSATGRPVEATRCRFLQGAPGFWTYQQLDPPTTVRADAASDAQGHAPLTAKVAAHRYSSLFREGGSVAQHNLAIEIEATGHRRKLVPVVELAPDGEKLYKDRVISATIELVAAERSPATATAGVQER